MVVALTVGVLTLGHICAANAQTNEWAWMGGTDQDEYTTGVYGTLGTPAAANFPGSRQFSSTWTDKAGNLWLFGGLGVDGHGSYEAYLNDLWRFNPVTKLWTWMGGSSIAGTDAACVSASNGYCGQPGVYGQLGTPSGGNNPGGREGASSWIDSSGNFWLFGGYGYDSAGTLVYLNDLWEFNPSTDQWAWMDGSSTVSGTCFQTAGITYCGGQLGVYGTLGTPGTGNIPTGREAATTWTDSHGNVWLLVCLTR